MWQTAPPDHLSWRCVSSGGKATPSKDVQVSSAAGTSEVGAGTEEEQSMPTDCQPGTSDKSAADSEVEAWFGHYRVGSGPERQRHAVAALFGTLSETVTRRSLAPPPSGPRPPPQFCGMLRAEMHKKVPCLTAFRYVATPGCWIPVFLCLCRNQRSCKSISRCLVLIFFTLLNQLQVVHGEAGKLLLMQLLQVLPALILYVLDLSWTMRV